MHVIQITRMRPSLLFLAVALLSGAGRALALDPALAITQYTHENWQTAQGLPQNAVQAVAQTGDGYVWLGTQEGLVRFDGSRFTVYDKVNTPALRQNWITSLRAEGRERLWVGLRGGGLVRVEGGSFTAFTMKDGLADDRVRCLELSRDGSLWVGTSGGGLSRLQDGRFTTIGTAQGLPDSRVVALHEDHAANLWVGTFGGGLSRYRDGRFTTWTTRDGLPDDQVSALAE